MKLVFKKRFLKDIALVNSLDVLDEIEAAIDNVKDADSLNDIYNLKMMMPRRNVYRIRVHTHRILVAIDLNTVTFLSVGHRSIAYKK